ncbi:unnamed protein product [Mytilus edulis]|uniref:Uncharacterized protein n=1 Tax=Mytilus edulis TaxID=6550 RepID=A0A8S3QVM4_MYTED|nr:unnamed protein product [Mytilus edulis]
MAGLDTGTQFSSLNLFVMSHKELLRLGFTMRSKHGSRVVLQIMKPGCPPIDPQIRCVHFHEQCKSDSECKPARISRRLKIKDAKGDRMLAMKVFAESIRFLKNNFLETLEMRISSIPSHYISWVLTVPAVWTDTAKQFMRLAALEAGIPGSQLTLAYEPEAAALYCRESTYQRKGQLIGPISTFGTGESLLILDCGGGTVDVTAYEIMQNGRLKELHEPTGGPWGGTMVDQAFMKFMKVMFGTNVWTKFEHEYGIEVLDIQRHFELKKRTIGESSERTEISFMIPRSLFDTYEEVQSKTFKTDIGKPSLVDIKTILLIGGYSDSALLRSKVKEEFPEMTVMCPDDAVLSVVKGAVIFGNTPELIHQRVSPLTYGIACNVPFDADEHNKALLVYSDNQAMCSCVFQVLVRKGDTVIIGKHDFETIFHPTRAFDREATVGIYTSTEHDPMYSFGPYVQELGVLKLYIPDARLGKLREIRVCLIFKSTELTVIAKEGGNLVSGTFNCLG